MVVRQQQRDPLEAPHGDLCGLRVEPGLGTQCIPPSRTDMGSSHPPAEPPQYPLGIPLDSDPDCAGDAEIDSADAPRKNSDPLCPVSSRAVDFDRWSAVEYYRDYYSERVEPDEQAAIRFQIEFLKTMPRLADRGIEYGCGPTLMRALAATPYVKRLDMADWHAGNLDRIRRWQRADALADDWNAFARYALDVEGEPAASVAERAAHTRAMLGQLLLTDARLKDPLGPERRGLYDYLVSGFCVDCFTSSRDLWRSSLRNVISLLKPGGGFTIFALREATGYRVGEQWFPAANVSAAMLGEALSPAVDLRVVECDLPSHAGQGYEGILMASGYIAEAVCPDSADVSFD